MDNPPNAKGIIEQLISAGMTQTAIAEALRADGIEISQATINRLKQGVHKTTSFEVGIGLMRLASTRLKSGKRGNFALSA